MSIDPQPALVSARAAPSIAAFALPPRAQFAQQLSAPSLPSSLDPSAALEQNEAINRPLNPCWRFKNSVSLFASNHFFTKRSQIFHARPATLPSSNPTTRAIRATPSGAQWITTIAKTCEHTIGASVASGAIAAYVIAGDSFLANSSANISDVVFVIAPATHPLSVM